MSIKNILLFLIASIFLISCKAEIVELDIKAKDVFTAVDGENGVIKFEAQFSNFGELDEEARAQIDALENILTKFMEIDDFEIENTDMGYDVILEGEMPITNKKLDATYYIYVTPSELFDGFTFLELKTGDDFNNLSSQMSAINYILSPDKFHPTKIKLKGKDIQVIVPATEIDGEAHLFYKNTVNGKISMKFDGGVFNKIGAGLFLKEN
jgi:hypothetical protein